MTEGRSCFERAAALKRRFSEALLALALASAGSTVRTPQQDASVDMWRNLGRPQRGTVAKRKTYAENPHFHMNERDEGRGTSHQIPSGGFFLGWGGCKFNKVLSVPRRNELLCALRLPKEEPPWSWRDSLNRRKAFRKLAQDFSVQWEKGISQSLWSWMSLELGLISGSAGTRACPGNSLSVLIFFHTAALISSLRRAPVTGHVLQAEGLSVPVPWHHHRRAINA